MKSRLPIAARILSALLLFGLAHGGESLAAGGGETEKPDSRAVPSALASDPGYRLSPEDIVNVTVWKEEGLQKDVLVRPDGAFSFPLVGDIQAAGRTAEEIRGEIAERLRKSINDPVVTVSVMKVAGYKIYVIGRVNRAGEFVAGRYIDVLQALSMAGGLTPYAAENDIKVLRKRNGKEEVFEFQYADVRRGRNLEQNITLQGGDVVLVP
jgi:polysaccharide biosynthesis/export protein